MPLLGLLFRFRSSMDGTCSDVRGIWVRFWVCSFAGGEDAGFYFGG